MHATHAPGSQHTSPAQNARRQIATPQHDIANETVLVIDVTRPDRVIFFKHDAILRPAEFRLLQILAKTPRHCVKYAELHKALWDDEDFVSPASLYSHRSRLEKKMREAALKGGVLINRDVLLTIRKYGIMLNLRPEHVKMS